MSMTTGKPLDARRHHPSSSATKWKRLNTPGYSVGNCIKWVYARLAFSSKWRDWTSAPKNFPRPPSARKKPPGLRAPFQPPKFLRGARGLPALSPSQIFTLSKKGRGATRNTRRFSVLLIYYYFFLSRMLRQSIALLSRRPFLFGTGASEISSTCTNVYSPSIAQHGTF